MLASAVPTVVPPQGLQLARAARGIFPASTLGWAADQGTEPASLLSYVAGGLLPLSQWKKPSDPTALR